MIDEILEEFKQRVDNNQLFKNKANNFIEDYEFEDDYSHNEIEKLQKEFIKEAKEYLIKNNKGEYIIYRDWCVHVCSIEFFNEKLKGYLHVYEEC